MGIRNDLETQVGSILRDQWETRDGTVVPTDTSIKLSNDAIKIKAAVLYADLHNSTGLVDKYSASFAAEIYKSYLVCAARIIRSEGGEITAYDGDRIMAVYIGSTKNSDAVRSALKIKWCVTNIINAKISSMYPSTDYFMRHVVGVDSSELFVAKTGIRSYNDLVWVGRAANYAAKLSNLDGAATYITKTVYDSMMTDVKISSGKNMWEARLWTAMNNMSIYRSDWGWALN